MPDDPRDPTRPEDPHDPTDPVPWRPAPIVPRPARMDRIAAYRSDPRLVAAALAVLAGIGAIAWLRLGAAHGGAGPDPAALRRADEVAVASGSPTRSLVAQVAGAVLTPGLVHLRDGDRVADAIAAAGGARPDADLDAVNLAARVADGERILVPVLGAPPVATGGGANGAAASAGPVHLNSATAEQLDTLPGIGPSLAAAIIRTREERGGFASVQDLEQVRGIGEARLAELEGLVAL